MNNLPMELDVKGTIHARRQLLVMGPNLPPAVALLRDRMWGGLFELVSGHQMPCQNPLQIASTTSGPSLQIESSSDYEFPFVLKGRISATAVEGHFPGLDWEY